MPRCRTTGTGQKSLIWVDTKVLARAAAGSTGVLGWDAVGRVVGLGREVTGFARGDRVFNVWAIDRSGCDSELHVVDHRLVGHARDSLDDAEAVALPLTSITALELLFDRLGVPRRGGAGQSLLIVGAAGGVGSMLVQLARQLTSLTVIGTASRAESQEWVKSLGAHHVIDHTEPWLPQVPAAGVEALAYQACLTHTHEHWASVLDVAAPLGKVALIDDPEQALDTSAMKRKILSLHWEFMFTRSLFGTPDQAQQGAILAEVAHLVDAGMLRTNVTEELTPINAANLTVAHRTVAQGKARGKIVAVWW